MMADCIHHNSQSLAFFIIQFSPMGYFCLLSDHIIFAVTFAAGLYVNCSSDRKRPVINMFFTMKLILCSTPTFALLT